MQNKLWTYGCSFTQGMWEFHCDGNGEEDIYQCSYKGKEKPYVKGSEPNWSTLLANELELKVENRGKERGGPLHAMEVALTDNIHWQHGDVVIFQPSIMNRFWDLYGQTMYHATDDSDGMDKEQRQYVWISGFFELMEKQNSVEWYWWTTEDVPLIGGDYKHKLLTFGQYTDYKSWMHSDPDTLFYDGYVKNVAPMDKGEPVDWHQGKEAHQKQADFFKKQIRPNLEFIIPS